VSVTLRDAGPEDAHLLWEWRNDPDVRANSFSNDPIPWEKHVGWFEGRLADEQCWLGILERDGQAIGQIRYEKEKEVAFINYSVAPSMRSQGIGTMLLQLSAPMASVKLGVTRLAGLVKQDNDPSIRAFRKAGFQDAGMSVVNGATCVRLELSFHTSDS
jgi:UDP-2,4-diacetamido-2,4,6-trideoxy-beta-L-altropyranose hydrolase